MIEDVTSGGPAGPSRLPPAPGSSPSDRPIDDVAVGFRRGVVEPLWDLLAQQPGRRASGGVAVCRAADLTSAPPSASQGFVTRQVQWWTAGGVKVRPVIGGQFSTGADRRNPVVGPFRARRLPPSPPVRQAGGRWRRGESAESSVECTFRSTVEPDQPCQDLAWARQRRG